MDQDALLIVGAVAIGGLALSAVAKPISDITGVIPTLTNNLTQPIDWSQPQNSPLFSILWKTNPFTAPLALVLN